MTAAPSPILHAPGTGRLLCHRIAGSAPRHPRRARPPDPSLGRDAWLRRLALDPAAHRWRHRDRGRTALQSTAPPRARRMRRRDLGCLREQPPRTILSADANGTPEVARAGISLATLRRGCVQGARTGVVDDE